MIGSREGCNPLELSRGAEGTDSPPHHPFSDSAEILRISGRGICKEAIFSPGSRLPSEKISTRGDQPKSSISLGRSRSDLLAPWASNLSAAQVAGLDWKSRGLRPSRALPEYSDEDFGSRRCGAWGAPLPYTPSGTGCERVHTLSRSPGAVRSERLVSDETGRRRVWNSSACSSAPVRSKISTSDEAVRLFWWKLWFPTTRAWGAPLPYTPRGRGARGFTPSRALPGAVRSERLVSDETDGQRVWDSGAHTFAAGQTKLWFLTKQAGGAFGTAAHIFSCLFGRRFRPPMKLWCCSGGNSGSRRCKRGALCSPTPPRGRGARGLRPSRALPRAVRPERLVSDGTEVHVLPRLFGRRFRPPTKLWCCSGGSFGSRRRGRGARCSPTPPRGRGARGFTPSRALPEMFDRRRWFPTKQAGGAF